MRKNKIQLSFEDYIKRDIFNYFALIDNDSVNYFNKKLLMIKLYEKSDKITSNIFYAEHGDKAK